MGASRLTATSTTHHPDKITRIGNPGRERDPEHATATHARHSSRRVGTSLHRAAVDARRGDPQTLCTDASEVGTMRRLTVLLCGLLLSTLHAPLEAADAPPESGAAIPEWFRDDVRALSADGGVWVADNAAYRSEDEPFDAYGITWTSSFDDTTLSGRLYGLRDGVDVGTFWEFRQYWDPLRGVAVLEQFGHGGMVGIGTAKPGEDGVMVSDQTFARPGGPSWRSGHRNRFLGTGRYETRSFDIVDGAWKAKRVYVWVRQGTEPRD